ncbi:MAG: methyl-accepting chemotaxis protein [Bacteriovoracaceae bacterium]|jgi:methyl-accepting chemotaxis protein|nr:methyl-accepting chemotaxis protein [Bacteriovoracaceae bacterium]
MSEVKKLPVQESSVIPFESCLESVSTNVFYADSDLTLTYLNKKARDTITEFKDVIEAKFGTSDILGKNLDFFHGDKKKQIRAILANKKNFPYNAKIAIGPLILDLNIDINLTKSGEIEGYIVNWEEISAKVELERKMAMAQMMVDLSPVNTMMTDVDGNLIYMNHNSLKTLKTLEHLLPVKSDDLVGTNIDSFHGDPKRVRKIFEDPRNLPHKAKIKLGDDTLDLLVSAIYDDDQNYLGPMVTWDVVTNQVAAVDTLNQTAKELTESADSLLQISGNMAAAAEETSAQVATASSASEEVNAGVQNVATSMEEMTSAIKEITRSTNESSHQANEALKIATETNDIITTLGVSSDEIGNVIKVISSIAQQTNLLALNATIEAARAGEAGKGFAVVANEVKELAKQTANATNDITKKIETIQSDSKSAVGAIGQIGDTVEKLHSFASTIAASVEEQAATTSDVARVVKESAQGVNQINENVGQVSEAAKQTGKEAQDAKNAAETLKGLASRLTDLVSKVQV